MGPEAGNTYKIFMVEIPSAFDIHNIGSSAIATREAPSIFSIDTYGCGVDVALVHSSGIAFPVHYWRWTFEADQMSTFDIIFGVKLVSMSL